ncbi:hypothetical protein MTO96_019238 [Rhipicephalus appendiculatus]
MIGRMGGGDIAAPLSVALLWKSAERDHGKIRGGHMSRARTVVRGSRDEPFELVRVSSQRGRGFVANTSTARRPSRHIARNENGSQGATGERRRSTGRPAGPALREGRRAPPSVAMAPLALPGMHCNNYDQSEDTSLKQLVQSGGSLVQSGGHGGSSSANAPWSDGETKLLLDYYAKYTPSIGPMKRFKCKREMFEQISRDIFALLNTVRTGVQCETRFKTISRRKRNEDSNNRTSGQSRCNVSYEEEFAAIRAIDDSLEPEVLRGVGKVTYKRVHAAADNSNPSKQSREFNVESTDQDVRMSSDATRATGRPERPRNRRQSMDRMKHMKIFFDEMYKINEEREARKEERGRRREKARAQRHRDIMQADADYVKAIKELGEGRVNE